MKALHSQNFIKALKTGDRELMQKVPRADVHNHAALGGFSFLDSKRRSGFTGR